MTVTLVTMNKTKKKKAVGPLISSQVKQTCLCTEYAHSEFT